MSLHQSARLTADVVKHTRLISFDVYGTLIDVRAGSHAAFQEILNHTGGATIDVKTFWEHWELENIQAYRAPYKGYKDICRDSLAATFRHFGLHGDPDQIDAYFAAFSHFPLYPDVEAVLAALATKYPIALVSNIDNDLLGRTSIPSVFTFRCTAENARGYKADGTLFKFLLQETALAPSEILHCGQSQYTDMVGGKPLGLPIAWINRRGIALDPIVPRPDFEFTGIEPLLDLVPLHSSHPRTSK